LTKKSVGGFIFESYVGDHPPLHVHVFRGEDFIGRWDIENQVAMDRPFSRKAVKALEMAGYRLESK
jgi:hypothetical protein